MSNTVFDPFEVYDRAEYELGTRAERANGDTFVFLKADADLANERMITYDENGTAFLGHDSAGVGAPAGASVSKVDDDEYGWFMIKGTTGVRANDTFSDNALLALEDGGEVSDSTTGVATTSGLFARGAAAAANDVVQVYLHFPLVTANA